MTLLQKTQAQIKDEELPAFVYFEKIIEANVNNFLNITKDIPFRRCLYSVKAASFPFLLNLLSKKIDGFDASSVTEAALIQDVLGTKSNIYLTAPAMTEEEMKQAIKLSPKCVHLDSLHTLELFLKRRKGLLVGLRINPGIGFGNPPLYKAGGEKSRLGIPLYELKQAFSLCRKYGLKKIGLHFHVSCQAETLEFHIKSLRRLSEKLQECDTKELSFTHVDLGGGIFPPLWDFEKDKLIASPIAKTAQKLVAETKKFIQMHKKNLDNSFSFFFEPGDFLVGSSAIIASKAIEMK